MITKEYLTQQGYVKSDNVYKLHILGMGLVHGVFKDGTDFYKFNIEYWYPQKDIHKTVRLFNETFTRGSFIVEGLRD